MVKYYTTNNCWFYMYGQTYYIPIVSSMSLEIVSEITKIRGAIPVENGKIVPVYDTPYGALAAPYDSEVIQKCNELAEQINLNPPSLVVLAGIGGSSMGALAILQAMLEQEPGGMLYATIKDSSDEEKRLRFLCADTIDNDLSKAYLSSVEKELNEKRRVLLIIVTKSGTTTETIINGALFLDCLKKHKPSLYHEDVVIITDAGSPLEKIAVREKFSLLTIPKAVGGRFSVFTAAGLFPLALMGIDIDYFCKGARDELKRLLYEELTSPSAEEALMFAECYEEGYNIHDLFVFSPRLQMLAQWYKQLIGESLGKKYSEDGELVPIGLTPTISLGTSDLHSVVQLYLDGPQSRITTFLGIHNEPDAIKIPDNIISSILSGLQGSSVSFVKEAIFKGVDAAYEKQKLPVIINTFDYKGLYVLGEFMMHKMVETIFLAAIWKINPFGQPAVELYKQETRAFLKNPKNS